MEAFSYSNIVFVETVLVLGEVLQAGFGGKRSKVCFQNHRSIIDKLFKKVLDSGYSCQELIYSDLANIIKSE